MHTTLCCIDLEMRGFSILVLSVVNVQGSIAMAISV